MNNDAYSFAAAARPNCHARTPERPAFPAAPVATGFAALLAAENVARAWQRVRRNNGAAGIDGITVAALQPVFAEAWGRTQSAIEAGEYRPLPVRRLEVPKAGGGARMLGIPAVIDRTVQQAIAQVVAREWEPRFSAASHAYRPGRSAHGAVTAALAWMEAGCAWTAHLDIEQFFDRVDHGRLLDRLAAAGLEARMVELVRQFLEAGAIGVGLWQETPAGTPQGSPLSPLLANIVLDGLDRRLEARGARHVRYADDILILGRTRPETEAMVENAAAYLLAELSLRLNEQKTRLTPAHEAEFLGFGFRRRADGRWQRTLTASAQAACRAEIAALTEHRPGAAAEPMLADLRRYLDGWRRYFTVPGEPWAADQLLAYARARVRRWSWEHWATPERRAQELRRRGLPAELAQRVCGFESDTPEAIKALGQAIPNAALVRHGLARPERKKEPGKKIAPTPNEPRMRVQSARPEPSGRAAIVAAPKAAPKRRGWFFNFSLGRMFTFRFLSENEPGVLSRPEPRKG